MPLADAFVADRDSLSLIHKKTEPARDLGAVDVKGIDIIKLAQLLRIFSPKPIQSLLSEFPEVHSVSDDGPWIFEISQALTDALAMLHAAQIKEIAQQWGSIQEFKLDGFNITEVSAILHDLVRLSQLARAQSKSAFLWTCL